jgi:hypothetical protein
MPACIMGLLSSFRLWDLWMIFSVVSSLAIKVYAFPTFQSTRSNRMRLSNSSRVVPVRIGRRITSSTTTTTPTSSSSSSARSSQRNAQHGSGYKEKKSPKRRQPKQQRRQKKEPFKQKLNTTIQRKQNGKHSPHLPKYYPYFIPWMNCHK